MAYKFLNTITLQLPLKYPEPFCMTYEPDFPGKLTIEILPAVVESPIKRKQNLPITVPQGTVLHSVPLGNSLTATYPIPKKQRVIGKYILLATESESMPPTPRVKLLDVVVLSSSKAKKELALDSTCKRKQRSPTGQLLSPSKHPKLFGNSITKGKQHAKSKTPKKPCSKMQLSPSCASLSSFTYTKPIASGSWYYGRK
ncbi:hypothetical protein PAXRUDRAFT_163396 [Paxillus rubicundulus Ve08.2h10]|uniref:Uncharacterized protein n=1 Tax=Paxillus rubicundulus Ve08.2h10 TaxID=930991 RepID=A0A0D0DKC5_9AGAM|nr:hypothetical protein PAXRUDRAFT_163396 [Paxillus rubicundulus Ve08.2h10]